MLGIRIATIIVVIMKMVLLKTVMMNKMVESYIKRE